MACSAAATSRRAAARAAEEGQHDQAERDGAEPEHERRVRSAGREPLVEHLLDQYRGDEGRDRDAQRDDHREPTVLGAELGALRRPAAEHGPRALELLGDRQAFHRPRRLGLDGVVALIAPPFVGAG